MVYRKKLGEISLFCAALFVVFLFSSVGTVRGAENPVGNVTGFIYAPDGNTPLAGAIVQFKNVSTGNLYESKKSDPKGFFRVENIERGVYLYGVLASDGNYNSEGLVGLRLKENETAKMSIALRPYSSEASLTMEEFYRDLEANGESYVGRVIEYSAANKIAQVKIERGFLQQKDKIHTKGNESDFKQGVDQLESEGAKVKRVYSGQIASLTMKQAANVEDMIFVVKKRQFLPFLVSPLGAAALIATSGAVVFVGTQLREEVKSTSPDRNKRKK